MSPQKISGFKRGSSRNATVKTYKGKRILCLADVHGSLRQINRLVKMFYADVVVHVGSFGFFDGESADGMSAEMLASAAQASMVVNKNAGDAGDETGSPGSNSPDFSTMDEAHLREVVGSQLSELPLFLAGTQVFDVPVYTIWGEYEDVQVLEKFRDGSYHVPNLHIVDAQNAPVIQGTSIRLLGVPGLFQPTSMFTIGEGKTVPGTHGSAWTGIWQIGELAHTTLRTHRPEETRWLLSSSPSNSPLLETLAIAFKCDAHIYSVAGDTSPTIFTNTYVPNLLSWSPKTYRRSLGIAQKQFKSTWFNVKQEVLATCEGNDNLKALILSTVKLLTTEIQEYRLTYAYDTLWHCCLANHRQSLLMVTAEDNGTFNIDVKNLGVSFHGQSTNKASTPDSSAGSTTEPFSDSRRTRNKFKKTTSPEPADTHPGSDLDTPSVGAGSALPKAPASEIAGESTTAVTGEAPANPDTKDPESHGNASASDNQENDGHGETKFDLNKLPTEPSGNAMTKRADKFKSRKDKDLPSRPKQEEELIPRRPGLWFKNGDRSPEEILSFLSEEDRKVNPVVKIIKGKPRVNGTPSNNALVYFDTQEQVSAAYERVNKDEAGTVSIYQPHLTSTSSSEYGSNGSKFGGRPVKRLYKSRRKWQP